MTLGFRRSLLGLALLVAGATGAYAAPTTAKTVNIFFWFEYVPQRVIDEFERETGIKVVYDTFEATEMLTTKVLSGKTGYDIVMPTASSSGQLITAGALQRLDNARLPNTKSLDADALRFLADQDPGNAYAVPYLHGTTGIMHNPKLIATRMPDAPTNSLDIIFKPEIASRFTDCGIAVADSPEGIMSVALNYLGFDPFSTDPAEIQKAEELLIAARPNIRHFKTGSIINEMAAGDLCLALGWSGDAFIAADRAAEANADVEVHYAIPKEGTEIFFDVMTIPADAPHPEAAYAFIDFLLTPRVMAEITNTLSYPNSNTAATPHVDERIRSNPNIYPPTDITAKLFAAKPRDAASLRTVTRAWTRFTSGGH
ncbi:extracellular solute-binding protein [Hyphomicrobium sp. CS1GBMeth3]|uniref:extracellular solute-binding protein n=1 Tax=Hyphomicrobium sp. CS1GBMeth3 TaxID=1892845 RepID=UPI000AAEBCD6|nr:extracellular solute-binding protein [Hyphomicrobium sp. CS1GBMeth3]